MNQNETQIKNIKEYVVESVMKHTSQFNSLVDFLKNHTPDVQDVNECTNHNSDYEDCSGWVISTARISNSHNSCRKCKKFYCEICLPHFMFYNKTQNTYICSSCIEKKNSGVMCGKCKSTDDNKLLQLDDCFKEYWCIYCDKCNYIIDKY